MPIPLDLDTHYTMGIIRELMEREMGFEPTTCAMATRRSSQLSYSRTIGYVGAGNGIRTHDLRDGNAPL